MPSISELLDQAAGNQGLFGAVRKHDIHTGTDLYCPEGTVVRAIEDGTVHWVGPFTGSAAGSPWWNDTKAVMVRSRSNPSRVILYGEIEPRLEYVLGDPVFKGEVLGLVKRVLKTDKGKPTSMLHLEVYDQDVGDPVAWDHGQPQPAYLQDSTRFLREEVIPNHPEWNLDLRYQTRVLVPGDIILWRNFTRTPERGMMLVITVTQAAITYLYWYTLPGNGGAIHEVYSAEMTKSQPEETLQGVLVPISEENVLVVVYE